MTASDREVARALANVTRKAGTLVTAEEEFRAAIADAYRLGVSLRDLELAARRHTLVGDRRGFTRERIRQIVKQKEE